MDWSAALPTFLITLREGVEATLVIGLVLAYLSKANQVELQRWVYGGAIAGVFASLVVGVLLAGVLPTVLLVDPQYRLIVKPLLEGVFGVAAIALLSWMLIWMTRQARQLKAEVETAVSASLQNQTTAARGIFTLIFFTVLREGFETVLFLAANFQQGLTATVGALGGIGGAVTLGILLFRLGVKINLRQFFQGMGILLLLIVGGLVISALHHFDVALYRYAQLQGTPLCFFGDLTQQPPACFVGPLLWDTSHWLPARQFPGIILRTLFGYTDHLFLLEAVAYVSFLLTVGGFYFWSLRDRRAPKSQQQPAAIAPQPEP